MSSENNISLITDFQQLQKLSSELMNETRIAVDLEADSMFHFKEKVCLIQIGIMGKTYIVDPLLIEDMSPLGPVFRDPEIRKVFHGADFDIRSLYRDYSFEVNNLYDTELASRFLGIKETGLASVIHARFGVSLDKKYQKKDWSVRPLPKEMLTYSAGDVLYLLELERMITKELKTLERLSWVTEECEILSNVRPAQVNHTDLFLKFKGAGRLSRRDLALLEKILRFRLNLAEKKDKPVFKIFSNGSILDFVHLKPTRKKDLTHLKSGQSKQILRYGDSLIPFVKDVRHLSEKELPVYKRKRSKPLKPLESDRKKKLKNWRLEKGEGLNIDPSLILNKNQMTELAIKNPVDSHGFSEITSFKNWQLAEFKTELHQYLATL